MVSQISVTLKKLRNMRGISQDELAKKSGVNKQTISRLERGTVPTGAKATKGTRSHTLKQLSDALEVPTDVLLGNHPIPESPKAESPWDTKSQFSIRIETAARNAISLVARRYRVSPSAIVSLAPFLFLCAAEQSLRQRQERVEELCNKITPIEEMRTCFQHMPVETFHSWRRDEAIAIERESIECRDLFGETRPSGADMLDYNYNRDTENPLAHHLSRQAEQLAGLARFERWAGGMSDPHYSVCEADALDWVGGDENAAQCIVIGFVGLHELPKELRDIEWRRERAQWILKRAAEKTKELPDLLNIDLANLLGGQDAQEENRSDW